MTFCFCVLLVEEVGAGEAIEVDRVRLRVALAGDEGVFDFCFFLGGIFVPVLVDEALAKLPKVGCGEVKERSAGWERRWRSSNNFSRNAKQWLFHIRLPIRGTESNK